MTVMRQPEPGRRSGALLLAAAGLCVGLSLPGDAAAGIQPPEDDTLEWLGNYQQALARAKETGRPLLVEFRCQP